MMLCFMKLCIWPFFRKWPSSSTLNILDEQKEVRFPDFQTCLHITKTYGKIESVIKDLLMVMALKIVQLI